METRIEATKAQHKIYRGFFLQLPNHTALRVSSRLRINYLVKFIGKRHDVKLQKSNLKTFSQAELKEYEKSYKSAKLWHGSGKYKYDINGEIVDVFANVLSSSSLNPARDVYAVIGGLDETHTISTTKLRIIARSYADTFGKGLEEKNRYGAASF